MKKKIIKGIVLSITVSVFLFALTTPTKAVEEEPDWVQDQVLRDITCLIPQGAIKKRCRAEDTKKCDKNLQTWCVL